MNSKFLSIDESLAIAENKQLFKKYTGTYESPIIKTLISLFFVFMYIISMYEVGCLDYSIAGIYGGVFGAVVFFVGIQACIKYFGLLRFIMSFKPENSNEVMQQIKGTTSYVGKWSLVLGSLYCLVYAINIPWGVSATGMPFLLVTWVGIVLYFGLNVIIRIRATRRIA